MRSSVFKEIQDARGAQLTSLLLQCAGKLAVNFGITGQGTPPFPTDSDVQCIASGVAEQDAYPLRHFARPVEFQTRPFVISRDHIKNGLYSSVRQALTAYHLFIGVF